MEQQRNKMQAGNNSGQDRNQNMNQKGGRDENGRFTQGSEEASRAGKLGGEHSQGNRGDNNRGGNRE